jgi:hypothetical protein
MGRLMPSYEVTVEVVYTYEIEADDHAAAEKEGWNYEDYLYNGEVSDITVKQLEEDEDE